MKSRQLPKRKSITTTWISFISEHHQTLEIPNNQNPNSRSKSNSQLKILIAVEDEKETR